MIYLAGYLMSHTPVSNNILNFIVPWLDKDWPLNPAELFGREAPLAVEIGFGNGHFLQEAAQARPDWSFIGIEKSWACVKRLIRRLDESALTNVLVLEGEGRFLLEKTIRPGTVDRMFIHHPDPWPRPVHHSRRIVQADFLELVADRLASDGLVRLATDHAALAEWISEHLDGCDRLVPPAGKVEDFAPGLVTRWAAKAEKRGISIRRFDRVRAPGPVPETEVNKGGGMANVTLKGPAGPRELFPEFKGGAFTHSNHGVEVVVRFSRLFRQADESSWLIEAMVLEGGLTQHLGVSVILREDGEVLIKPHALGHPRPTWGVKAAVRHAAWLVLRQNPELEIVRTTVGPLVRNPEHDEGSTLNQ